MCGRFTLRTPAKDIAQAFGVTVADIEPRYNIAPSQPVAAVRQNPDQENRELVMLRWGLVPFWADDSDIGFKTINARAETVLHLFHSAKRQTFRTVRQASFFSSLVT